MISVGDLCIIIRDYFGWKGGVPIYVPIYVIDRDDQLIKAGLAPSGSPVVVLSQVQNLKNIYYENYYCVLTQFGPVYVNCVNVKKAP